MSRRFKAKRQARRDFVLGKGVPRGWYPFGYHVDQRYLQLEFRGEGRDGLPLWERPR